MVHQDYLANMFNVVGVRANRVSTTTTPQVPFGTHFSYFYY